MPDVTILTERELRAMIALDAQAVGAIEDAFRWLAEGKVEMPPIMHIEVSEGPGDVDIKSAYVRGLSSFAVKIGAGFFGNAKLGLPNSPACVVVVSAKTGAVEAVLLDNAYLTDVRTGAAGAVAARHLANPGPAHLGVIGAGVQARFQAEAANLARPIASARVWSRDVAKAQIYAAEMSERLGVTFAVAPDAETVVRECDLLVTTTPSKAPLVKASWLHPGLHITAMGADLAGKQELEGACFARAGRVVADRRGQCAVAGDLQHALASGAVRDIAAVAELGEVILGRVPGRTAKDQITICDLTGTGVQDTAIAVLAMARAKVLGLGTVVGN